MTACSVQVAGLYRCFALANCSTVRSLEAGVRGLAVPPTSCKAVFEFIIWSVFDASLVLFEKAGKQGHLG